MCLDFYPLYEADESRPPIVAEGLVYVQHGRVLRVVVSEHPWDAQLDRLGERLQFDRPGQSTPAILGVATRVAGPDPTPDRRKTEKGHGHRAVTVACNPETVVGPVR